MPVPHFISGPCGICCGKARYSDGRWCEACGKTGTAHIMAEPSDLEISAWRWAELLIERDDVQGPEVLQRMVDWYAEHDGRADDFGRLRIVIDAENALESAASENKAPRE